MGDLVDRAQGVVWVVEDDAVFLHALTQHLSRAGYDTVGFADSMMALTNFDAGARPDLLIADIVLRAGQPHGVALGSMLRMKQAHLPVIYVTGYPSAAAQLSPYETVFRKPVDLPVLAAAVRTALRATPH